MHSNIFTLSKINKFLSCNSYHIKIKLSTFQRNISKTDSLIGKITLFLFFNIYIKKHFWSEILFWVYITKKYVSRLGFSKQNMCWKNIKIKFSLGNSKAPLFNVHILKYVTLNRKQKLYFTAKGNHKSSLLNMF